MIAKVGRWVTITLLALSGCGVGDSGGNVDAGPSPDVSVPETSLCSAQITVTGTFTAAMTLDPAGGCQPQGTWAVTATVSDKGTCATVPLKASYSYTFSGTGRDTKVTYAKATGEEFQGNVAASGSGGCEGSFEHILPDGGNFDQLVLHAFLPVVPGPDMTTLPITGSGDFDLWQQHP